ncbi:MAG TPA: TSUP family transporter [Chthonomonadaceae bacterium]|nr:TSUP family transporter [Chthonomonadaceae bacterium]
MDQPPVSPQTRRRKPLNLTAIKSGIVFCVALVTAVGSALSGLGAQVAFAPMLTWMLGFAADKALATALRYAAFTAFAAVVGAFVAKVTPTAFVQRGLLLVIAATAGAILAAPFSVKPGMVAQRRLFQSLGVLLTLFTIVHTARLTAWDVPHFAVWNSSLALAGLGFVVGALTQVMGLASGTLLIPALTFLAAFKAKEAVALSLLVVALASALPAWSYARRGLADATYGNWAVLGGIVGGFAGGLLLAKVTDSFVLLFFAVIAMFLCGRELARMA